MYGLLATQFNGHMVAKLRAWFHRQLRAVVNMPAHLTKINNRDIRAQFGLKDPIHTLLERIERKIQHLQTEVSDPATRGPGILSFWQDLHHNLQQADTQTTSARIDSMHAPHAACIIPQKRHSGSTKHLGMGKFRRIVSTLNTSRSSTPSGVCLNVNIAKGSCATGLPSKVTLC